LLREKNIIIIGDRCSHHHSVSISTFRNQVLAKNQSIYFARAEHEISIKFGKEASLAALRQGQE
jgi:hypothetical protein